MPDLPTRADETSLKIYVSYIYWTESSITKSYTSPKTGADINDSFFPFQLKRHFFKTGLFKDYLADFELDIGFLNDHKVG